MPASKRSNEIAAAFQRLLKTGEKSTIENIGCAELETAIFHYYLDKNMGFYEAMETRLQELKELKTEIKDNKKTQKGLLLSIAICIIGTVIGGLLLYVIIKTYF